MALGKATLSACTIVGTTVFLTAASTAAQAITLKLAHQWPQVESDYVIATAIKFAKEVEERSNGDIKIQFFPAQSLVKASNTHTALKNGTVDLASTRISMRREPFLN